MLTRNVISLMLASQGHANNNHSCAKIGLTTLNTIGTLPNGKQPMSDPSVQALILVALGGYLIGSFPTALLVVRWLTGKDVRSHGSGNIGTLNTLRTTNSKPLTLLVLVGDISKGVLSLILGYLVAEAFDYKSELIMEFGGIAAIVGHNYSAFLKLGGGKGLATALPVLLYLEPTLVGVWLGTFFITVAITRLLVLGQILGTVAVPLVALAAFDDRMIAVGLLAFPIFVRHAPRIKNIINGTEPKMFYKVKGADQVQSGAGE